MSKADGEALEDRGLHYLACLEEGVDQKGGQLVSQRLGFCLDSQKAP